MRGKSVRMLFAHILISETRLYHSSMDSEDAETSASRIHEVEIAHHSDTSTENSVDSYNEMDDYLDQALEGDDNDEYAHQGAKVSE